MLQSYKLKKREKKNQNILLKVQHHNYLGLGLIVNYAKKKKKEIKWNFFLHKITLCFSGRQVKILI